MFSYKKKQQLDLRIVGKIFKLKKIKNKKEYIGKQIIFEHDRNILKSIYSLETNFSVLFIHPNLILSKGILLDVYSNQMFVVSKYYMCNLNHVLKFGIKFHIYQIKSIIWQILIGTKILHKNGIIHNDIKIENILLSEKGTIIVCDFGSAKFYFQKNLCKKKDSKWCNFLKNSSPKYKTLEDLWKIGQCFVQLLLGIILFSNKSEIKWLTKFFTFFGIPNLPHKPTKKLYVFRNISNRKFGYFLDYFGLDLLNRFFTYNFFKKISIRKLILHPFFF